MNTYKTKDSLQHPVVIIKRKRRKNLGRKSNKKKQKSGRDTAVHGELGMDEYEQNRVDPLHLAATKATRKHIHLVHPKKQTNALRKKQCTAALPITISIDNIIISNETKCPTLNEKYGILHFCGKNLFGLFQIYNIDDESTGHSSKTKILGGLCV